MSFSNKVVIVTGASSGIGAATAKIFAKEKANVVIIARNVEKLNSVAKDIKHSSGTEPFVIIADISKDVEVRSIVERTIEKYGKIDVLINNAGIISFKNIYADDFVEDFDRIMSTNLRGTVVLTHAAIPHLIKTKGNIINVSSIGSFVPYPMFPAYVTSKAGMDHFSRSIALQLAEKGVRVNLVNPGPVKTDINMNALGVSREESEKLFKKSEFVTPLKLISESEEIGDLIAFLASDKAKSITGGSYTIDCGVAMIGAKSMS